MVIVNVQTGMITQVDPAAVVVQARQRAAHVAHQQGQHAAQLAAAAPVSRSARRRGRAYRWVAFRRAGEQ